AIASMLPQSRRPLVWLSMFRIVTSDAASDSSGMYFLAGSSSESFPSRASRSTEAAVNCFDTEPASKIVSGVFFTSCSRSAMPYAFASVGWPSTDAPTEQPGVVDVQRAKMVSMRALTSAGATPCATIAAVDAEITRAAIVLICSPSTGQPRIRLDDERLRVRPPVHRQAHHILS